MEHRRLGKTNFNISSVSLGTWQLGTRWGDPFNASEEGRFWRLHWNMALILLIPRIFTTMA